MIAADDAGADAGLIQPPQLLGQKAGRLHRGLIAVVKVTGDQQRIDLLREAEVDDPDECLPSGVADQLRQLGMAHRQRAQRRVEMNVGSMNEAKSHRISS